jgi:hypothetical protein
LRRLDALFTAIYAAINLVLKAALAHFRFVTIHPFDDGIARIRHPFTLTFAVLLACIDRLDR